tara:strand:+ start:100 stop:786 length:687 start_codon:yes stop_codon:yes gene_type:complete
MSVGSVISAGIGLIGSALQYRSSVAEGRIQQQIAEAQARNERLKGRVEAVKAQESANEILRRTKRALASNIARGYSSGVLPEVGSAAVFSEQQVLRPAALDVGILDQDAFLAIEQSERQARNLEYKGRMAARQAQTAALGNLFMSVAEVGLSGAFSGLGSSSPTSTLPVTPMARPTIPVPIGGSLAGNASQINTAGNVALNRAVNPMFVGQTSPLSGGVYNTAGGGLI